MQGGDVDGGKMSEKSRKAVPRWFFEVLVVGHFDMVSFYFSDVDV